VSRHSREDPTVGELAAARPRVLSKTCFNRRKRKGRTKKGHLAWKKGGSPGTAPRKGRPAGKRASAPAPAGIAKQWKARWRRPERESNKRLFHSFQAWDNASREGLVLKKAKKETAGPPGGGVQQTLSGESRSLADPHNWGGVEHKTESCTMGWGFSFKEGNPHNKTSERSRPPIVDAKI